MEGPVQQLGCEKDGQQFKRSCVPDGIKLGSVGLSPKSDFRMPSDAAVTMWLKKLDEIE